MITDQKKEGVPANPNAPVVEGVGFATFRPDGLVGLHAGYGSQGKLTRNLEVACDVRVCVERWLVLFTGSGSVLTKPFLLGTSVKQLLLNVNSGVGGEVRVAVVDGVTKEALPGLDLEHAIPLTRDSLSVAVAWTGQPGCCGNGAPSNLNRACSALSWCTVGMVGTERLRVGTALAEAAKAGRAVRLMVTMEDAWLFSFWFE